MEVFMAFESQLEKSKKSGGRTSVSGIMVAQTYKPSTKSEGLSIRVNCELLEKVGLEIGDRVDVLYDKDDSLWMLKKSGRDGFSIAGKKGGPTGLIRYTLKPGHHRLTHERADLPVKLFADMGSVQFQLLSNSIIFKLKE